MVFWTACRWSAETIFDPFRHCFRGQVRRGLRGWTVQFIAYLFSFFLRTLRGRTTAICRLIGEKLNDLFCSGVNVILCIHICILWMIQICIQQKSAAIFHLIRFIQLQFEDLFNWIETRLQVTHSYWNRFILSK